MSTYTVALGNMEPEQAGAWIDHLLDDEFDDEGVDDGLDDLEGATPDSTDWKRLIASFDRPASRPLGQTYQREKQDTKHRMGDLLEECFKAYEQKFPGDVTGANFYHWLDGMHDWDRLLLVSGHQLMRGSANPNANIKPSMVKAFMKGVAYMDKATKKSHRVHFNGGTAYFKGGEAGAGALGGSIMIPLSTAEMSTVFSGKGFGIWVISEKGKLYVGNHVKGLIHHSSFLSGANVMCGGEMWARDGKITFVTAKSGHYNPGTEHLAWALRVLQTCVDNFDQIKVMAWRVGTDKLLLVHPTTILWDTRGFYSAWGRITPEEMGRLRAGNFASFPEN